MISGTAGPGGQLSEMSENISPKEKVEELCCPVNNTGSCSVIYHPTEISFARAVTSLDHLSRMNLCPEG